MRLRKATVVALILRFASGKEKQKLERKKRENNEWPKKCGGLEKLAIK